MSRRVLTPIERGHRVEWRRLSSELAHVLDDHRVDGVHGHDSALGYMAAIILWNRSSSRHLERFRNAGRMAVRWRRGGPTR